MIGNGWYNPILQYQAYYNYTSNYSNQPEHPGGNTYGIHYNASVDAQVFNALYGTGNCYDQLIDCNNHPYATNSSDGSGNEICNSADNFCYNQIELPYDNVFNRDEYDSRYLMPDPFPPTFYVDYLNTPEVQAAIGAFTNFSESSSITGNAFGSTGDDAREIGVTAAVEYLLDHNVTVTMYFGDADFNCNWFGGEAFSYTLSNVPAYTGGTAGFVNISTSDGVVHGQIKTAGHFSFVRIYESGHEVPFYQPLVSLELLNRTLHGVDLATGLNTLTADYVTNGTAQSTYDNTNATVTYEVIPVNATYNVTTNEPNPPYNTTDNSGSGSGSGSSRLMTRLERALLDYERAARGEIEIPARRTTNKIGRRRLRDAKNLDVDVAW